MKHFLRVFAVALAMGCLVLALGCSSGPSPSEVTATALDAIKAQDGETLQTCFAGETSNKSVDEIVDEYANIGGEATDEAENELAAIFLGYEYELGKETIDGDTATVEATITTYDTGAALASSIEDYLAEAFSMALNGASEEELSATFQEILNEKICALTEKDYTGTTTFSLTKVDGQWKLDEFTEENTDCLLGGILSTAKSLAQATNGAASEHDAS